MHELQKRKTTTPPKIFLFFLLAQQSKLEVKDCNLYLSSLECAGSATRSPRTAGPTHLPEADTDKRLPIPGTRMVLYHMVTLVTPVQSHSLLSTKPSLFHLNSGFHLLIFYHLCSEGQVHSFCTITITLQCLLLECVEFAFSPAQPLLQNTVV